jgi:GxxExxY protein
VADLEEIATTAVDCGLRIHRDLGPGLLESVYETVLAGTLSRSGLKVERQRPITIRFEDMVFADAFRVDLLVEDRLIIAIKSIEALGKVHAKQLLTYLRLMQQPLGLLMNFGGVTFKEGLKRIVNEHRFASSRLRVNQTALTGDLARPLHHPHRQSRHHSGRNVDKQQEERSGRPPYCRDPF